MFALVLQHATFEVPSFTNATDMIGDLILINGLRDSGHFH